MDDTVKLWDIRKLGGGVIKTFADVPTHLVSYSPLELHTHTHGSGGNYLEVAGANFCSTIRMKVELETLTAECDGAGSIVLFCDTIYSSISGFISAGHRGRSTHCRAFDTIHAYGERHGSI